MNNQPITEDEARVIVQMRLQEPVTTGNVSTLDAFAKELHATGVTRRLYRRRTIDNILKGRTYPQLKDAEGKPIVWADIPRGLRGRLPVSSPSNTRTLSHRVALLERQNAVVLQHLGLKVD